MAVAGPVLVATKSAEVFTVVVAVDELFDESASASAATPAVLVRELLFAAPASTCVTTWNVATSPELSWASVPLIWPLPPDGGSVNVNVGPLVWVAETSAVPAG